MSLKNIKAKAAQQLSQKEQKQAQSRLDTARGQATSEGRQDAWINALTGIGGAFTDKRNATFFRREAWSWDQAEDLWRSDDAAARVVEILPDEMTREGFELKVQNEEEGIQNAQENPETKPKARSRRTDADQGTSQFGGEQTIAGRAFGTQAAAVEEPVEDQPLAQADDSKDIAELMMSRCEELDVMGMFRQVLCFERAYGGGAILVGANDGQTDWSKPLDEQNIRSIDFLNVLEPRELLPLSYYGDPRSKKYGEPAIYQLNRIMVAGESPNVMAYLQIHESRLIRFDGIRTGRRMLIANGGWGDSLFIRVAKVIRDFQSVWDGAALLLSDFAQATFKMKDLADYVAKNGTAAVAARAQAVSMSRAICNTVLIDTEEEFTRTPTPMAGFPEMLDRFCNRLAMAVKTPVTILMGQAPAGLNATGQADLEWFANQVRAEQQRKMLRQLLRLIHLMFLDKSGITRGVEPNNWSIKFKPLKQLSQKEEADVHFVQAQADNLYVQNETLLPAEVAKSRWGGDDYSIETSVDLELREQTRAAVTQGETIDDPFHTGAGEPGASNAIDPALKPPADQVALAQLNQGVPQGGNK